MNTESMLLGGIGSILIVAVGGIALIKWAVRHNERRAKAGKAPVPIW